MLFIVSMGFLHPGCAGTPKNPTTVQQIEDKVRDGVPLGSTRAQVEAWLKSQGIKSHYSGPPNSEFMSGNTRVYPTYVKNSGLDPETIGGIVSGSISDTKRDFGVTWSIRIHFFLDQNGKTIKHQVAQEGTGL